MRSSFVPSGTVTTGSSSEEPVANNGFWPDLDPADFRAQHRLDGTVTPARLGPALATAAASINRTLRNWQQRQADAGHQSADSVPVPVWLADGVYEALYRRAVYALAHASLVEHYANYDATNSGGSRGEALASQADSYRRDAAWAVAEIEGRPHTTVELI